MHRQIGRIRQQRERAAQQFSVHAADGVSVW
jgi:hypothetical protein